MPWPPADVMRLGAGVTSPRLLKEVKPTYTGGAVLARIQGRVQLEVVVQTDGTVGEVRVKDSLDAACGLDQQAVSAVKQWRFMPGTKDGAPVPVLVDIEMTFALRDKR